MAGNFKQALILNLKYKNTTDDIEAYGHLIYSKSPTVKQHRKRSINAALVLSLIVCIVIYFIDTLTTLYIWLVIATVWIAALPLLHRRKYIKKMVKTYQEEGHEKFFGTHTLTIKDDGLTDEIENGYNHTTWDKIEHIEAAGDFTFIFSGSAMAYSLPRHSVIEGDYDQFLDSLKAKQKQFGQII